MLYLTIMLIGIDPAMFCMVSPTYSTELQYSTALVEKCAKEGKTLVVQKGESAKKEPGKVYCVSNLDVVPKGITEYVPRPDGKWMVEKNAVQTSEPMIKVCGPNGCTLMPQSQYQSYQPYQSYQSYESYQPRSYQSYQFYGGCTSCGR